MARWNIMQTSMQRICGAFVVVSVFLLCTGEEIGHECGIAFVRLKKPLAYYQATYGSCAWGAHKVCSLIEEQRNRGQDGAGIGVLKCNMQLGEQSLYCIKNAASNAIDMLMQAVFEHIPSAPAINTENDEMRLKKQYDLLGEMYIGHVRYGTYGGHGIDYCQPYLCENSNVGRAFMLAGNFNMTNTSALLSLLASYGRAPAYISDTHVIMALINHGVENVYGQIENQNVSDKSSDQTPVVVKILQQASQAWDGGYVFVGMFDTGEAFICRDPAGIRPAFFYANDELVAGASERAALMNVFEVGAEQIQELLPGHVIFIDKDGSHAQYPFVPACSIRKCCFERIYFSRASDAAIYQERKQLGKNLASAVLKAVVDDDQHMVVTYIPNSSEPAFFGLVEEIRRLRPDIPMRAEKLVHKNQHLRTFIAQDQERRTLVSRLYAMTKGVVQPHDTLVVIDDSIVRGTTLRESILKELIRLNPKRIIFVSSAPPILYPDCYGIDLSQLGRFIGFQAIIELLRDDNRLNLLEDIYQKCAQQQDIYSKQMVNYVQELYVLYSLEEIAAKIVTLVKPKKITWNGDITIIYQTVEGLQNAIPDHTGDWYFTGNYPTPGGYKVLNTSYLQWFASNETRAY